MPIAARPLALVRPLAGPPSAQAAPTTAERFELKYWATEEQARALVARASSLLVADPFVAAAGPRGAWNVSLYLDTPRLTFFENHLAAMPDRSKLRIRTYAPLTRGASPPDRAYMEIKRRANMVTMKQRTVVSRADAIAIAAGQPEKAGCLRTPPGKDLEAFLFLQGRYQARPTMLVRARRQAYFGRDPGTPRVTLDRDIECQRMREPRLDGPLRAWCPVIRPAAVLIEVKFRDAAPGWLTPLVEDLGLARTSFSKYIAAVGQELRGPVVAHNPDQED